MRRTILLTVLTTAGLLPAQEVTPADREFFEKRVRPLLVEHCHSCHSAAAKKQRGGLLLDSASSLLKGGDTGPAVVPGKAELFEKPVLGPFLRAHHCFPLHRGRGDARALKWLMEVLEQERCLGLFPEGTRSRGGEMKRPKPGVGYLAHRTGAPVVPVRVRGADRFPWRRGLDVHFGALLRYGEGPGEDDSREGHQAFADRVMETIRSL